MLADNSSRSSTELEKRKASTICFLLVVAAGSLLVVAGLAEEPLLKTIEYKDNNGIEHEEYAFRRPLTGLPEHVLEMFCASTKLRIYWDVFRVETKASRRKGLYLRRMARLTRHLFPDIRDADKPFNETMYSAPDDYFRAPLESGNKADRALAKLEKKYTRTDSTTSKKKWLFHKFTDKVSDVKKSIKESDQEWLKRNQLDQLGQEDFANARQRANAFLKYWAPKVALGLYTRIRTMWWLMMSCLFAKYFLWDPALDEFMKLQRSLVMWPEMQLVKMHELSCKPIMFFKRLLDTCKVLNPLMRVDFGQFSLDKLTRFKSG